MKQGRRDLRSARSIGLAALACSVFSNTAAWGQLPTPKPDRTPPPYIEVVGPRTSKVAVTSHKGIFEGHSISYKAIVAETFVPGVENKTAEAAMVSIAYVRTDDRRPVSRPVLFMFNGGPGASSTPLQSSMAPRVPDVPSGGYRDNPDSILDVADLVFVDPVGAGLSRALPGRPVEQYWSTKADAQSFRYFIQRWLKANGREKSPRYVIGESYGTARAGHIVELGADLALDGVVLISSVGYATGLDIPYMLSFPTFAAAAAFHGKADAKGMTPEENFRDNMAFARGPYLATLVQGDEAPNPQKDAVMAEASRRLGVDPAFFAAHNYRLENYDFMLNLLKAEGQRTGQLDSRAKGDLAALATRSPPYDDPSMSLGKAENTPARPAFNEGMNRYLRDELGYVTDDGYIGLNLKLLFAFRHDVEWSYRPTDSIAAAMKIQPKLRLMLAGGIYDITTPLYGALYNLAHSGIPRDKVTLVPFVGGHEVYAGRNRSTFNLAIHKFVLP